MNKKPKKPDPLRTAAEAQLPYTPAAQPSSRPAEKLLHELRVHQIELEMQNDNLRKLQVELESSRDRYVDFYDFSPVGYLTLNHAAMIEEINLTGAALLGVERKRLLHHRFASLIATKDRDRWDQHFHSVLKTDDTLTCELVLLRGDGSRFHAQLTSLRLGKAAETSVVRIVLADITERRQAEEELRFAQQNPAEPDGRRFSNPRQRRGDCLCQPAVRTHVRL